MQWMYNVMIVDDEPIIKNGLISFVNWASLGCHVICEASNGFEAMEHLNSFPIDIIVTDIKMPGMDGIELAKYVYENYPQTKVIFSTSYPDFSYAQSAIKYNVVDFVVKTNPTEKIPTAIHKAKQLILQQKKMEETISGNLSEIREKVIADILNGIIISPEVIKSKLEESKISLDHYFIVAFEISGSEEQSTLESSEEHNKFIFSLKNYLSLALTKYQHFTFMMNKNLLVVLVSFKSDSPAACLPSLLSTCNEIIEMVVSFIKFSISIGISEMHTSELDISQAYHEAQAALLGNFYDDNHVSTYNSKARVQTGNKTVDAYSYTDNILSNLQEGNPDQAAVILLQFFDACKKSKEPIEQVKVSGMLICSHCFRLLANHKPILSDDSENEAGTYKQIQNSKSLQNIYKILCQVIQSTAVLMAANKKQYNHLVKEAIKYIRENYHKDISLQSIADFVHVNSSYLSRLYKKETGETIIDTLNKYRIEIAKKLLMDPSRKTFEVGAEVGIENPAYFTHVFTKYANVSPKEFKAKG
jgi:two-component system response regulator YesN